MTDREVMQQALEALVKSTGELHRYYSSPTDMQILLNHKVITTLKAALAQSEQEPSQWRDMVVVSLVREGINKHKARELADHFATPPAAQRKSLTDDQLDEIAVIARRGNLHDLRIAIEAAHGIKEGT